MKRQLRKTAIMAAGLFCATQALASWTEVTDQQEIRSVQASSAFQGYDIYGQRFVGHFHEDGAGDVIMNGASIAVRWHFDGSAALCVEWQEGTECYRVQKSDTTRTDYRAVRVRDGQAMPVLARQGRTDALSVLGR